MHDVLSYLHSKENTNESTNGLGGPYHIFFSANHSDRRLSELENEANVLRRQLQTSNTNHEYATSLSVSTQIPGTEIGDGGSRPNDFSTSSVTEYPTTYVHADLTQVTTERQSSVPERSSRSRDPALSRTLNGKTVEGYEIDEIFDL
jgi:hypothetical protein